MATKLDSGLVVHDGGTVKDVLDTAKPLANYTALRAYNGTATQIRITSTGIAGFFYRDDADTTSADNGGTIIVAGNGKRWKRLFDGPSNIRWFGAKGDWNGTTGTDDTLAIQSAINSEEWNIVPNGSYKLTSKLTVDGSGKRLTSESMGSSWSGGEVNRPSFIQTFNGDMVELTGGRHHVEGIQFKSDGIYTGAAVVIRALQNNIIDCAFYRNGGGAIKIIGLSYGTYIEKNTFDGCGSLGNYDITVDAITGPSVTDYNTITHIEYNIFENSYVGAVSVKDTDPFYIFKNYIEPYNSLTTSPMIRVLNSTSGNSKGWIKENYIGSLTGNNGFAIHATGSHIVIDNNDCNYFPSGIYLSSLIGSVSGNCIEGFSSAGIQISTAAAGVNNNIAVSGNILQTRPAGATHGILLGGSINNTNVSGNVVNGKCDYYIRLLACYNSLIASNTIAPFYGQAVFGIGVFEDTTNTGNNQVKANLISAETEFNRSSFSYDIIKRSAQPTAGTWKLGDVVFPSVPVAGGPAGWECIAAGTPGTWRELGSLSGAVTVANLRSAVSAGIGARSFVSDATSSSFNTVVSGGGANKVPVFSDGTNWLIG